MIDTTLFRIVPNDDGSTDFVITGIALELIGELFFTNRDDGNQHPQPVEEPMHGQLYDDFAHTGLLADGIPLDYVWDINVMAWVPQTDFSGHS